MDDEEDNSLPLNEILDDKLRVHYFKGYLAAVAQAIKWVGPLLIFISHADFTN